jgi:soluble lytic murein transglycosylase-like protein
VRRLPTLALAALALASLSFPAPTAPARVPPRAAPRVAAEVPAPFEEVAAVGARLARHATALTRVEERALAETIVREARRNGLPVALVIAVMHVESRFHAFARSSKGALGLMQVLPSTAEEIAASAGVDWSGPRTLFDPEANVRLGIAYLAWLVRRYGELDVVLAAYNAGPGAIEARLRAGQPLPARYARDVLDAYGAARPRS